MSEIPIASKISRLILGSVQLGLPYGIHNKEGKPDLEKAHAILRLAWQSGIRMLDTAEAYGDAIDVIGAYHLHHSPFEVISKFGHGDESLSTGLRRSLTRLNSSALFAYLYHKFEDLDGRPGLAAELNALKAEGLIGRTGISIYTNDQFERAIAAAHIDVIQIPFNLLDNMQRRGALIRKAKAAGKEIHVRSVFLQGLFFMPPEELPANLRPLTPALEAIHSLASGAGMSVAEFALNYVLSISEIDGVLIGVDSPAQLQANMDSIRPDFDPRLSEAVHVLETGSPELLNPVNWK